MRIIINHSSMIPIYEQIVDQLKAAVISGELPADSVLPSVRGLSGELKISALTVKKAYDALEQGGFVATIHGKGTFVRTVNPQLQREALQKEVEDKLDGAVGRAKSCGMTESETRQLFDLVMEDYYGDNNRSEKKL